MPVAHGPDSWNPTECVYPLALGESRDWEADAVTSVSLSFLEHEPSAFACQVLGPLHSLQGREEMIREMFRERADDPVSQGVLEDFLFIQGSPSAGKEQLCTPLLVLEKLQKERNDPAYFRGQHMAGITLF